MTAQRRDRFIAGYVLGALVLGAIGCGGKAAQPGPLGGVSDAGTPPVSPQVVLPTRIGGSTLTIESFDGAQIADPKSAQWTDLLTRIGAKASDLHLSLAVPAPDAKSDFQMGAFRITGTDWSTRIAALVNDVNAVGKVSFTQVQLGGKTVYRAETKATPAGPHGYFYIAGETLVFASATNEAEIAEALSTLPAARPRPEPAGPAELQQAATQLPPRTGVVMLTPLRLPSSPFCVGELGGLPSNGFLFMVVDGNGVPVVASGTQVYAAYGIVSPPVTAGAMVFFNYLPTVFGGPDAEHIHLNAFSVMYPPDQGTFDFVPPQLLVFECLSGTQWADSDRIIEIDQKGTTFTAHQLSGSETCGAPGLKFSGVFTPNVTSTLIGSDLSICNPPACVSAGFLPKLAVTTYQGLVSPDAKKIDFTWDDLVYTLNYQDGTLISCVQSSTVPGTFSLTRSASDFWKP